MDNYILIKELPDASVGTEVIWDESASAFYYEKSYYVSPHNRNYLPSGLVTQTPDFFCEKHRFPDHYAYNSPVYSRKEILELLKTTFSSHVINGISIKQKLYEFEFNLRKLGKLNAEKILNK